MPALDLGQSATGIAEDAAHGGHVGVDFHRPAPPCRGSRHFLNASVLFAEGSFRSGSPAGRARTPGKSRGTGERAERHLHGPAHGAEAAGAAGDVHVARGSPANADQVGPRFENAAADRQHSGTGQAAAVVGQQCAGTDRRAAACRCCCRQGERIGSQLGQRPVLELLVLYVKLPAVVSMPTPVLEAMLTFPRVFAKRESMFPEL